MKNTVLKNVLNFMVNMSIVEIVIVLVIADVYNWRLWVMLIVGVTVVVASNYAAIRIVGWIIKTLHNQHKVEVSGKKNVTFTAREKRNIPVRKNGRLVEYITDLL